LLKRVIPVFLRELPGRTARLRAAYAAQDVETLAQLCHGLKGASRILGANELAAAAERIEREAYGGTLPDAEEIGALLDLAGHAGRALRRNLADPDT
jgi:HPt (histidine-containing phosphotransfer) domain-containing protein